MSDNTIAMSQIEDRRSTGTPIIDAPATADRAVKTAISGKTVVAGLAVVVAAAAGLVIQLIPNNWAWAFVMIGTAATAFAMSKHNSTRIVVSIVGLILAVLAYNLAPTVAKLEAPELSEVSHASSEITLKWTKPEGVFDHYEVYRNDRFLANLSPLAETFTDHDSIEPKKQYTYYIRAVGQNEASPWSNAVSVTTSGVDLTLPPINDMRALEITANAVKLAWSPRGVGVSIEYRVLRDGATAGTTRVANFHDQGLSPGKSYTYTVRYKGLGEGTEESQDSNELRITTLNAVSEPTRPGTSQSQSPSSSLPSAPRSLQQVTRSANSLTVGWVAPANVGAGIAKYRVYRDSNAVADVTTLSFTDANLEPTTEYTYYLVAFDKANKVSQPSASVLMRTAALPGGITLNMPSSVPFGQPFTITGGNVDHPTFLSQVDLYIDSDLIYAPGLRYHGTFKFDVLMRSDGTVVTWDDKVVAIGVGQHFVNVVVVNCFCDPDNVTGTFQVN